MRQPTVEWPRFEHGDDLTVLHYGGEVTFASTMISRGWLRSDTWVADVEDYR